MPGEMRAGHKIYVRKSARKDHFGDLGIDSE
jgi:hypothetical protein